MEINTTSSLASSSVAVAIRPATIQPVTEIAVANSQQTTSVKNNSTLSVVQGGADTVQQSDTTDQKKQPNESELIKVTDELNNFMESMNTDIKFVLHTRTNELMIQVQDSKTHKILKECPSHELLDVVAKMRDYVGALLDKKA